MALKTRESHAEVWRTQIIDRSPFCHRCHWTRRQVAPLAPKRSTNAPLFINEGREIQNHASCLFRYVRAGQFTTKGGCMNRKDPLWQRLIKKKTAQHFRQFHSNEGLGRRSFLQRTAGAAGLAL